MTRDKHWQALLICGIWLRILKAQLVLAEGLVLFDYIEHV